MSDELLSREISSEKDIFLKVSRYEGQVFVHLRHYYRNDDDELRPTKKGVCLNKLEFEVVRDCLPECEMIFDKLKKRRQKLNRRSGENTRRVTTIPRNQRPRRVKRVHHRRNNESKSVARHSFAFTIALCAYLQYLRVKCLNMFCSLLCAGS